MDKILEVKNLKKYFGHQHIIEDLSFEVGNQEIVGFLGPNGSGKSTTLKCIVGLYHTTGGMVSIGGYSIEKDRKEALTFIGQSIENPTLFPNLTGRDHLKMMARWHGVDDKRVKEMEEFSGLGHNIDKNAGQYSMGMKMRLMLSLVLLHRPKLVILDEPTNGLDPQAVFKLREEMQQIRDQGSSILFSSHQLGEVEKIADRVILINHGDKIYDGVLPEHLKQRRLYQILVSDISLALPLFEKNQGVYLTSSDTDEDQWIRFTCDNEFALSQIMMNLQETNIRILDFNRKDVDLESFYKSYYKE